MRAKTAVLILFFVGIVLYFNSIFNGFIGDDFLQIVHNTKVHSLTNIFSFFTGSTFESGGSIILTGLFYRPLMLIIFSSLYTFFGPNPSIFHLIQLLLHTGNAILIFIFIRKFIRNELAFLIALIFLIHPINNEAVVYAANLQETLFFFFGMSALLVMQYMKNRLAIFLLTSLFLLLSLFSKESGLLFIIISYFYVLFFSKKNFNIIFYCSVVVLAPYFFLRYFVANMHLAQTSAAPIAESSLLQRIINMPYVFFYYIKTFFYPIQITSHQYWIIRNLNLRDFFLPLLISFLTISVVFLGALYFWRYQKKLFSAYLFFSLWYLLGIIFHLQFIPLDAIVADRWFYFPIVGFTSILTLVIYEVYERKPIFKKGIIITLLIICLLLSVRTIVRTFDWKDELTLFSHDVKTTRPNFILHNYLATALINNEEFEKAKPYVLASINERPYYANLNNMAVIYLSEQNIPKTKYYLQKSLAMTKNYMVYENYSNFLLRFYSLDEARVFTEGALKFFPRNYHLWLNMGKIYYLESKKNEAISAVRKAYLISHNPEDVKIIQQIQNNSYIVIK